MLPLSVMRLRLELMPAFAGCTKQKFPTTSTIQKSLSPVAASMIFSVAGTSMSVVYLTFARIGIMSCEWYGTVRAEGSWAIALAAKRTREMLAVSLRLYIMASLIFTVGVRFCDYQVLRLEWVIQSELTQAIRDTEPLEIVPLSQVVTRTVGGHPVRDGIDVQLHFFRGLCLTDKHLSRWYQPGDQIELSIVKMECLAVDIPVHIRIGEKDFGRAALGYDRQQSGVF